MKAKAKNFALKYLMFLTVASIEAFLAILCVMAGLPILLHPEALSPDSILAILPGWLTYLWAGGLTVGGSLTFTGILLGSKYLERSGIVVLAVITAILSFALLVGVGFSGLVGIFTYSMFSLAMIARYWVLGQEMKITHSAMNHTRKKK